MNPLYYDFYIPSVKFNTLKKLLMALGFLLSGLGYSGAVSADIEPRPYVSKPGGCDGFADYSDEIHFSNFQIVDAIDQGDGTDLVTISFQASNNDAGVFNGASAIPRFENLSLGVMSDSIVPATFGAIAAYGVNNTETSLYLQLPSGNASELVGRLNNGEIPFTVFADESTTKKIDYQVAKWADGDELAFVREAINELSVPEYPFDNNQQVEFSLFYAIGGLQSFEVFLQNFKPGDNHSYILEDTQLWRLSIVPHVYRNLRIVSVFWDEDPEIIATGGGGILEGQEYHIVAERTLDDPVLDMVASGSYCTGRDGYIDLPVQSSRLTRIDGVDTDAEARDLNPQPIRFNDIPIESGVTLSGQIQGHILKPHLEIRIRNGKLRWVTQFDTDISMSAQLRAQVTLPIEKEVSLYDLCFPIADIPIGPVKISINLQLNHWLGVQGNVTSGMITGIQKHFHNVQTIGYDGRLPEGRKYFSNAYDMPRPVEFTPPQLTGDTGANANVYTRIRPTLRIGARYPNCDTGIGAYAEINAYGNINVSPLSDPWWKMGYGSSVAGGMDIQLFGLNLFHESTQPTQFAGSETREAPTEPPTESTTMNIGGSIFATDVGRKSGEDQRWAVAIDDLITPNGFDETSITGTTKDNGVLIASHETITSRNRLIKLDRYGAFQWSVKYKGGYQPMEVVELPNGNIAVTGQTAWLALHDAQGNLLWNRDYNIGPALDAASARCRVNAMAYIEDAPDEYGFLLAGGTVLDPDVEACAIRVNSAGDVIWAKTYDSDRTQIFYDVIPTSDGNWAVAGRADATINNEKRTHPLIAKLDSDNGDIVWAKRFPMDRSGILYGLAQGSLGTLYAVGNAQRIVGQTGAALILSVNAEGGYTFHSLLLQDSEWEQLLDFEPYVGTFGGDSAYDTLVDIVPLKDGFAVAGFSGLGRESAAWVAKINDRFGVEWFNTFDGDEAERFNAIAATPDGLLVSGWSNSLQAVGQEGEKNWLWAMKLPFEGGGNVLPELGLTTRFMEPSVRDTTNDPDVLSNDEPNIVDHVFNVSDASVRSVNSITGFILAPSQLCVTRLTHSGRDSLLDACIDTTPNVFEFAPQANVFLNTMVESNTITVSGIEAPVEITVSNGEYRINNGEYVNIAGQVNAGDHVQVRHNSALDFLAPMTTELIIGGLSAQFVSTTEAKDTTPDPFLFDSRSEIALNTLVESNTVVVSGINFQTEISVLGGEYSINGGDYSTQEGLVDSGDIVRLRVRSADVVETVTTATLNVGSISVEFNVTTYVATAGENTDNGSSGEDGTSGGGAIGHRLLLLILTVVLLRKAVEHPVYRQRTKS